MCVIVLKPAGKELAEKDVAAMWARNSDGAGVAWFDDRGIMVRKGLMKLKHLEECLPALTDFNTTIHFRLATHGQRNAAQTHPFVVSPDVIEAKAGDAEGPFPAVLFHNGIITGFGDKDQSDTLRFVTEILAHIPEFESRKRLLEMIAGKFALLQNGVTYLTTGFEERDGITYSNTHWKPYHYNPNNYNPGTVIGGNGNGKWDNARRRYWGDDDGVIDCDGVTSYGNDSHKIWNLETKKWETPRQIADREAAEELAAEYGIPIDEILAAGDKAAALEEGNVPGGEHQAPGAEQDFQAWKALLPAITKQAETGKNDCYLDPEAARVQASIRRSLSRAGSREYVTPCEHNFDDTGYCTKCNAFEYDDDDGYCY